MALDEHAHGVVQDVEDGSGAAPMGLRPPRMAGLHRRLAVGTGGEHGWRGAPPQRSAPELPQRARIAVEFRSGTR